MGALVAVAPGAFAASARAIASWGFGTSAESKETKSETRNVIVRRDLGRIPKKDDKRPVTGACGFGIHIM
jgi:hypothetical protein